MGIKGEGCVVLNKVSIQPLYTSFVTHFPFLKGLFGELFDIPNGYAIQSLPTANRAVDACSTLPTQGIAQCPKIRNPHVAIGIIRIFRAPWHAVRHDFRSPQPC
jgi:hypothetical protein